ncbi:hypothetical protein LOZ12_001696 [Ophidiomyces ophidiicola]|uniref:uncharacterized protein n=1 Tax=Ophidiomyces ophidiicola TaxID=1387563 RepID=UPI0020C2E0C0|nr:uncharacterized protein LOZ57_005048 [Ophidiomyces ophidiicola]KAI1943338.1 hypothetical protein LOZ57_005048 [Ophidiomyces ophidiicola]KAI1952981.1 hypothetical protein LOZ62_001248 [Ophidiomyces ophidiicola]KAI1962671.1 hypothetical protein LOZ59_002006 [Ophidiomyces ophidiicola]KAI1973499.1 hypothetical protein LOZ56_001763 [Ophidiomyces ophidiicola]KAI2022280.1 hypothetical protein LOZ45_004463 [Ophidiomyces ophidiicola]
MLNPYLYRRDAKTPQPKSLWWAAERGPVETLRLAVRFGAEICPRRRWGSLSPLSKAIVATVERVRDEHQHHMMMQVLHCFLDVGAFEFEDHDSVNVSLATRRRDLDVLWIVLKNHRGLRLADIFQSACQVARCVPMTQQDCFALDMLVRIGLTSDGAQLQKLLRNVFHSPFDQATTTVLLLLLEYRSEVAGFGLPCGSLVKHALGLPCMLVVPVSRSLQVTRSLLMNGADATDLPRPLPQDIHELLEEVSSALAARNPDPGDAENPGDTENTETIFPADMFVGS